VAIKDQFTLSKRYVMRQESTGILLVCMTFLMNKAKRILPYHVFRTKSSFKGTVSRDFFGGAIRIDDVTERTYRCRRKFTNT
jgi:hypothetical protein